MSFPVDKVVVVDARLAAGRGEQFSASYQRQQAEDALDDLDYHLPLGHRPDGLDTSTMQQASVDRAISEDNVGFKLLQKMGWKGKGLGRHEDGIVEPVRPGVEAGVRLGVGKQEEDDFYTQADNITRKRLETEIQASEDQTRKEKREAQAERELRIKEDVAQIMRTFFCEVCNKQYTTAMELDTHLSSYDHHHRKRLMEMKAMTAERNRGNKQKKEEKRMAKEIARLNEQLKRAQQEKQKLEAGSAPPPPPDTQPPLPPPDTQPPPPPPEAPVPPPPMNSNGWSAATSPSTTNSNNWPSAPAPASHYNAWPAAPPQPTMNSSEWSAATAPTTHYNAWQAAPPAPGYPHSSDPRQSSASQYEHHPRGHGYSSYGSSQQYPSQGPSSGTGWQPSQTTTTWEHTHQPSAWQAHPNASATQLPRQPAAWAEQQSYPAAYHPVPAASPHTGPGAAAGYETTSNAQQYNSGLAAAAGYVNTDSSHPTGGYAGVGTSRQQEPVADTAAPCATHTPVPPPGAAAGPALPDMDAQGMKISLKSGVRPRAGGFAGKRGGVGLAGGPSKQAKGNAAALFGADSEEEDA